MTSYVYPCTLAVSMRPVPVPESMYDDLHTGQSDMWQQVLGQ